MMEPHSEAFQVKRLGEADAAIAQKLFLLLQEVFGVEYPATVEASYLKRLLRAPGFIVYAAVRGDEIAGGLTAYELPMYSTEATEMFLYDIAVSPAFQRKGIGRDLLSALREYCRQSGIKDLFVAAAEEDAHALDFYHATGGIAEKVVHFTYHVQDRS